MSNWRRWLFGLATLAVLLGLAAGGVAALGWQRWGTAGWYFHRSPTYFYRQGRELLRQGHADKAQRLALLLEADGHKDHARLLRAAAFYHQARPLLEVEDRRAAAPLLRRALTECNRVEDQAELRVEAAILMGQCLLYLQQLREAARVLQFALAEWPDSAEAHRALAAVYYDQGALLRAVPHLEEAARLEPRDGRPHRFLGHIYKDLDSKPEAVAAFQAALERDLGELFRQDVQEQLAELLTRQGNYAEALAVLDAHSRWRELPALLALRAECLLGQQRPDPARALLDEGLGTYPAAVELLRLRARLHLYDSEPQAAARLLHRALAKDPHDFASRFQLAQALEALDRKAEAAEQRRLGQQTQDYLAQLTELNRKAFNDPWDGAVRRQLAEVCQKLGKTDLAAMWLQAAQACTN